MRRDHRSSFSCHSFFSLFFFVFCINGWSHPDWKHIFIYISSFCVIFFKSFSQAGVQFVSSRVQRLRFPRHRGALDKITEDVDAFVFLRGGGFFLWPLPLSQDEATPPSEATTPCCYVESRLTAFPPFMVGVPELFLERCFSSISCSDGSLYIQTVAEVGEGGDGNGKKRRGDDNNRWTMESRLKRWMWRQREGQVESWKDN